MTSEAMTYDLTLQRGVRGTATVMSLVEPFSKSLRIKADPARHSKVDIANATRISVLREIGAVRDMLSAWCWTDTGMPAKILYSAADLSRGQTWNQLIWNPERISQTLHNSPEGDRQRSVAAQHDGTSEDLLLLIAARIAWPRLRLGQTYAVPLLSSITRLATPEWTKADLTLGKDRETVVTAAGRFRTYALHAKWAWGRTLRIDVEADPPNRIVRWIDSTGEKGELTAPKPAPSDPRAGAASPPF